MAASALAAVVGALLASQLGVYGTILGAAVVSAGATTGGALFQHLFRRTGEQLREISGGSVPLEQTRRVESVGGTEESDEAAASAEPEEKTQLFDPFDPGGDHTRMMAQINPPDPAETVAVYRGRTTWKPRSWRVYAITATLVFVIALGAVGAMELAVGKPADQFFGGGGSGPKPGSGVSAPADPSGSSSSAATSTGGSGSGSGSGSGAGGQGQSQGNGSGHGAASPGASPSSSPKPDPSPSSSAGGASSPSPGASSSAGAGSGTGGSAVSGDGVAPSATPSP
ncbi:hypothetical protein [Streptacidiphilus fuscans]|uniref:Uncharacterized protein n=1 Tax=Streptacidiphilus fuscans TaxID=2789292 RepID=A0A931FI78_9ACTN|nr:hypothetical protein [Streptacidiphilus fuscans]MBF9071509.1 hypothetical protein [Streptacidiphilus fuscans]